MKLSSLKFLTDENIQSIVVEYLKHLLLQSKTTIVILRLEFGT